MGALDQWAKDNGLNAAELEAVEKVLGDDRAKKVAGYGLRQSDYDRRMDEDKAKLAAELQRIEELRGNLEGQMRSVGEFREGLTKDQEKLVAEHTRAVERAGKLEARLRQSAINAGEDPDEVVKQAGVDGAAPEPRKKVDEPQDDDRFKRLEGQFGSERLRNLAIDAELNDVADEHYDLFGKRLSRSEILQFAVAEHKRTGEDLTPRQAWERKWKVDEKRQEVSAGRRKAEDEQLVKDTETRVRSEMVMGGTRQANGGYKPASPALQLPRMGEDGKEMKVPEHHSRAVDRLTKAVVEHGVR